MIVDCLSTIIFMRIVASTSDTLGSFWIPHKIRFCHDLPRKFVPERLDWYRQLRRHVTSRQSSSNHLRPDWCRPFMVSALMSSDTWFSLNSIEGRNGSTMGQNLNGVSGSCQAPYNPCPAGTQLWPGLLAGSGMAAHMLSLQTVK
jgi:hypothetical protein